MSKHKSDYIIEDIIGGFKIFFISTILIYIALAVVNSLYPSFPIKENWGISITVAILLALGNYIKDRNKNYFGR